jgi:predicted O-methyltransferase YrrM
VITREEAIARSLVAGWKYTDEAECGYLYDLAGIAPDGPALEIGVLFGASFITWTAAREERGEIIAIDNWTNHANGYDDVAAGFALNLAHYGLEPRIITGVSWECAQQITKPLAFLFIDGDHVEGIQRDIEAYLPLLMRGGIVAFHDYFESKKIFVKPILDAWIKQANWPLIGQVNRVIAFRKP